MTETSKTVRSLGFGKSMLATLPPSSSAISIFVKKKSEKYDDRMSEDEIIGCFDFCCCVEVDRDDIEF